MLTMTFAHLDNDTLAERVAAHCGLLIEALQEASKRAWNMKADKVADMYQAIERLNDTLGME